MINTASYPSLKDRHCLVTGGATGIGEAIVQSLCLQNARVTFLDIDEGAAQKLIRRSRQWKGAQPSFLRCDLTDVSSLQQTIGAAIVANGPIRGLINNAANDERHDWREVTSAQWDSRLAVNLKHQFFAIQAVAQSMSDAGGGAIVNFSSIAWKLSMGGLPAYVTAKSGVVGLTRSFARDLGKMGIRVNCVLPGWIMTERQRKLYLTPEAEYQLLQKQCLNRLLDPGEVAQMVLFLLADDSSACTAQSFVVDAGWV